MRLTTDAAATLSDPNIDAVVVATGSVRSKRISRLVKSEPQILYHRGAMIEAALKRERVTPEEIAAAARGSGHGELDEVETVLLETDGSFSVIARRRD